MTELTRCAEAGCEWLGELLPEHAGIRRAEALVREVGTHRDGADVDQARVRRERRRFERAFLDSVVERDEEVHRRRCARRQHLPRDVRAVDQTRRHRFDRVAPAVRGEVRTGDLEHAGAVAVRLHRRGRLLPVLRDVVRARNSVAQIAVAPHGRERECHENDDGRRGDPIAAAWRERAHARGEEAGETEHDDGNDARRIAQCQSGGGVVGEPLEHAAVRARIVVRPSTDADNRPHDDERHEETSMTPTHDAGRAEGEHGHRETRRDHRGPVHVRRRLIDRETEPVEAVEVPIPQPAQQVDRIGLQRDRAQASR